MSPVADRRSPVEVRYASSRCTTAHVDTRLGLFRSAKLLL